MVHLSCLHERYGGGHHMSEGLCVCHPVGNLLSIVDHQRHGEARQAVPLLQAVEGLRPGDIRSASHYDSARERRCTYCYHLSFVKRLCFCLGIAFTSKRLCWSQVFCFQRKCNPVIWREVSSFGEPFVFVKSLFLTQV